MAGTGRARQINGVDVDALLEYIDAVQVDPARADRHPAVTARWIGGTRAEVVSTLGGPPVYIGGDDDPSAMGMLLRAMAACDVEVVVNKASLLGIEIEQLSVETRGYFNVRRYLGLEAETDSGYQNVAYTIRLRTRGATAEQIEQIKHACEYGSPIADTLRRIVPVDAGFEVS